MPYKPMKTRRRKNTGTIIGIILMSLIIIGVVIASGYYFTRPTAKFDKQTLCPIINGKLAPKNNVVILIDETDPLSGNQKDFLKVEMEKIVRSQPPGTLISIYYMSEKNPIQRTPEFCLCAVRDGSDANTFTENEALLHKRFEKNFATPFRSQLERLNDVTKPAKESKIFEQIQAISVNTFMKYPTEGVKELYIFSDMLHNSKGFTLYSNRQDFSTLKKSNYFAEIRSQLRGIDVSVYYFANQPKFQTNKNVAFWEKYFNELGAALVKVEPIGK